MLRRKKQSQCRLDKASADLHSVEEILHGIQNAQTVRLVRSDCFAHFSNMIMNTLRLAYRMQGCP